MNNPFGIEYLKNTLTNAHAHSYILDRNNSYEEAVRLGRDKAESVVASMGCCKKIKLPRKRKKHCINSISRESYFLARYKIALDKRAGTDKFYKYSVNTNWGDLQTVIVGSW